jgi:hypothetical protein
MMPSNAKGVLRPKMRVPPYLVGFLEKAVAFYLPPPTRVLSCIFFAIGIPYRGVFALFKNENYCQNNPFTVFGGGCPETPVFKQT